MRTVSLYYKVSNAFSVGSYSHVYRVGYYRSVFRGSNGMSYQSNVFNPFNQTLWKGR